MGGPSAEREVSLSSGRGCADALRVAGYEVVEIALGPDDGAGLPSRLAEVRPDDLAAIVADVITRTGASGMKDMGKVMGVVKPKIGDQAEGGRVAAAVKKALA